MSESADRAELFKAFTLLKTPKEAEQFLIDILTPQELSAVIERWLLVKALRAGTPQRHIRDMLGVAIATITRGSRQLKYGSGGFERIMKRMGF